MVDPRNVLVVVSFVLIAGLLLWSIIALLTTSKTTSGLPCPLGLCASNIYDGSRRCGEEQVLYNPAYEVCNAPDACTNERTPCVYLSPELGTSCPNNPGYTGLCTGTCRCLERVVCPNWASVYFTPYSVGGFTSLLQQTVWTNGAGTTTNQTPLSPQVFGQGNGICGVSSDSVSKIWPPDGCLVGKLAKNEVDGLFYCANTDLDCGNQTLVRQSNGQYACV
ncbi:MAG: hypothetical protein ACYCQJ_13825 [Nitrososphaerales archaeon]